MFRVLYQDLWKIKIWRLINPVNSTRLPIHSRTRLYSSVRPPTPNSSPSETLSYFHGITEKPLVGATIGQLIDQAAEKYPEREAYVFCKDEKKATYSEVKQKVENLASGFLAIGLKRGDRVGIWGPDTEEWILTQFAAAKAGLILVTINPAYQVAESYYVLKTVGCKGIVAASTSKTQDFYKILCEIAPELPESRPGQLDCESLPQLKHVIMMGEHKRRGTMCFDDVMNAGLQSSTEELVKLNKHLQFDDPVNIHFTSGTTGKPKGVILSHHGIINNGHAAGSILKYQHLSRICVSPPLFHTFALVLGSISSLVYGATAVYPSPSFNARDCLMAVHNERCTSLYGTPTMFIDMLSHEDFDQFNLTSLHTGVMAGAPCHIEVIKAAINKMHMKEMTIVYGITEASAAVSQTRIGDSINTRVSTVGRMHPNVEGKIIDKKGEIVPVGEQGEFCIRGYGVTLGYWGDKQKTMETIDQNGWLMTGDFGSFDEHGNLRILGRDKDMIIRGGENIYPAEIEQFLHQHPKIQEVEIIGVPDKRMGEEICAWIRLTSNETATAAEIKEFCKGKIAHFKIPCYVKFVDEFPMTVTGKAEKYKMREISSEELGLC